MIGPRLTIERGARDEAEKPFWISYADLMTSLAIVFLIVMVALLVAVVVQTVREQELRESVPSDVNIPELMQKADLYDAMTKEQTTRAQDEENFLAEQQAFERQLQRALEPLGISVLNGKISFGEVAQFADGSSKIEPNDQATIRKAIALILSVYSRFGGPKVLDRIEVEGFASPKGDYLFNLDLSLDRSQSLMCALLTGSDRVDSALDENSQDQVARLFAIGGRSSNDVKPTDEESRRVELTLQYRPFGASTAGEQRQDVPQDKIFDYDDPGACQAGA